MVIRLPAASSAPHPAVFMFLITPFGVMSGYLSVTIVYLLTQAGVSVDASATLVALSYIPHSWKFLWAPIADTTLTRRKWYLIAAVVSALGIYATAAVPAESDSLPVLTIIVLVSNVAVTFLAMAVESLMAYCAPDDAKGRAGGWFQAGNLGGYGLGGGAGLWLAQVVPPAWLGGAILAVACLLCSAALAFVSEPPAPAHAESYRRTLIALIKDLWRVARSRRGYLALLICFLPIGTGAASNLWSAVADEWHASASTVALVTGVIGGIVSAVGCLVGGYLCDRMDRKLAYALYGVMLGGCAAAMALAPRTETMYVVFTMVYAFLNGFTYAAFSAVVLEAIGQGAAATKYSLFASLSNMPIGYMTAVDGWAAARWGGSGMLYVEAAIGVVAVVFFAGVAALAGRSGSTAEATRNEPSTIGGTPG
ncbi:MAG TPA: MFS transporter [Casimicrobiaceae bacterium]|nr:MFS transporter [Casimicrobiaceae bacterium]